MGSSKVGVPPLGGRALRLIEPDPRRLKPEHQRNRFPPPTPIHSKRNSVVTAKVKRRIGCAVKSVPINRRCCWSVTYRAARRCRASLTSCCWQCFSKGNLPSHPRSVQPACLGVLDKWRPTSARRSSSTNRSPAKLQVPSPPCQAPWQAWRREVPKMRTRLAILDHPSTPNDECQTSMRGHAAPRSRPMPKESSTGSALGQSSPKFNPITDSSHSGSLRGNGQTAIYR